MRASDARRRFRLDGDAAVSPERLVVLLYERLVRDLDDAAAAMVDRDHERTNAALLHAQQIVEELAYAIKPEVWAGGHGLLALYDYVHQRLVEANVRKSPEAVDDARVVVGELSEAWREAYSSLQTAGVGEVA
ncbi:MAG: flagellar export chaperone FliS [Acidimicrobiales bacterium]